MKCGNLELIDWRGVLLDKKQPRNQFDQRVEIAFYESIWCGVWIQKIIQRKCREAFCQNETIKKNACHREENATKSGSTIIVSVSLDIHDTNSKSMGKKSVSKKVSMDRFNEYENHQTTTNSKHLVNYYSMTL